MVTRSVCRLCGGYDYKQIGIEAQNEMQFSIARCTECSLIYTVETYGEVSPEYVSLTENDLNDEHLWLQGKHKEEAFRQCLQLVSSLSRENNRVTTRPQLLDVGCGIGQWLAFAKSTYDCYGFDASVSQSAYARQNHANIRCASNLNDYRRQLDYGLPMFDLITLWDVLEHIRQPLTFVADLTNILSDKGLLYASVPAAMPMVIKQRLLTVGWPKSRFSWSPHEHVAYYSPKTLRELCKTAGLHVLQIGTVAVYPRPLSVFELVRRTVFQFTRMIPQLAPQIYVLATKRPGNLSK